MAACAHRHATIDMHTLTCSHRAPACLRILLLLYTMFQANTAVVRLQESRLLHPAMSPLLSVSLSLVQQTTPGKPARAFTRASLRVEEGADVAVHLRPVLRAPGAPWEASAAHGVVVMVTSMASASRELFARCHVLMLTGALLVGTWWFIHVVS